MQKILCCYVKCFRFLKLWVSGIITWTGSYINSNNDDDDGGDSDDDNELHPFAGERGIILKLRRHNILNKFMIFKNVFRTKNNDSWSYRNRYVDIFVCVTIFKWHWLTKFSEAHICSLYHFLFFCKVLNTLSKLSEKQYPWHWPTHLIYLAFLDSLRICLGAVHAQSMLSWNHLPYIIFKMLGFTFNSYVISAFRIGLSKRPFF